MARVAQGVTCSDQERKELERLSNSRTGEACLANFGTKPLSIIEVQCGDYVGEDDIIRFDDSYGRKVEV